MCNLPEREFLGWADRRVAAGRSVNAAGDAGEVVEGDGGQSGAGLSIAGAVQEDLELLPAGQQKCDQEKLTRDGIPHSTNPGEPLLRLLGLLA